MAYEKEVPDWKAEGTTLSSSKLTSGWQEKEKPPANWFNSLFYRIIQAIKELQTKSAEKTYVDTYVDALDETKIDKTDIAQVSGQSTTLVMSQKAVTDSIDAISGGAISGLDNKIDKTSITSATGTSTTLVMSQKGVTDGLANKIDKTSIVSNTGTSTTNVMSQKGVSDLNTAQTTALNNGLALKMDKTSIVQTTGTGTDKVISQKVVTDSLNAKVNTAAIKQVIGTSTTDIMSQAGIKTYVESAIPKISWGTTDPPSNLPDGSIYIKYS